MFWRIAWCCFVSALLLNQPEVSVAVDGVDEQDYEVDEDNFDLRGYLEGHAEWLTTLLNTGQNWRTLSLSIEHYRQHDAQEGKDYPRRRPHEPGYSAALRRIESFLRLQETRRDRHAAAHSTLVIYHLGHYDTTVPSDVLFNNVVLFAHALAMDSAENSTNFYWINALNEPTNQLVDILRKQANEQHNVALVEWKLAPTDVYIHLKTLMLLQKPIAGEYTANLSHPDNNDKARDDVGFGTMMFFSQGVRGPTMLQERGEWIDRYRSLFLPAENNVGLVGSTLSCELRPHVQSHAFMLSRRSLSVILEEYAENNVALVHRYMDLVERYEMGLSETIQRHGLRIAALVHEQYAPNKYFENNCLELTRPSSTTRSNSALLSIDWDWVQSSFTSLNYHTTTISPLSFCEWFVSSIPLHKWGGGLFRMTGFVCPDVKLVMQSVLVNTQRTYINKSSILSQLRIPESLLPDSFPVAAVNRLYYRELLVSPIVSDGEGNSTEISASDVCFVVYVPDEVILDSYRVLRNLNESIPNLLERDQFIGLQPLFACKLMIWNESFHSTFTDCFLVYILALSRQVDQHFLVVFYTFNASLLRPMQELLMDCEKCRFLSIPVEFRSRSDMSEEVKSHFDLSNCNNVNFSMVPQDSHLAIMDEMAKTMSSCNWLIWLHAKTVIGSQFVAQLRVLDNQEVDVVLPIVDALRLTDEDLFHKEQKTFIMMDELLQQSIPNVAISSSFRPAFCSRLFESFPTATVFYPSTTIDRSKPTFSLTSVDVHEWFGMRNIAFRRDIFQLERLSYLQSNVTKKRSFSLSYLVNDRLLRTHKLGSLKNISFDTMLFELPSPLWCMASEHVFLDSPFASRRRCFAHKDVFLISDRDHPQFRDLTKDEANEWEMERIRRKNGNPSSNDIWKDYVFIDSEIESSWKVMIEDFPRKRWTNRSPQHNRFDWSYVMGNESRQSCLRLTAHGLTEEIQLEFSKRNPDVHFEPIVHDEFWLVD
jgi:hypothetical protein